MQAKVHYTERLKIFQMQLFAWALPTPTSTVFYSFCTPVPTYRLGSRTYKLGSETVAQNYECLGLSRIAPHSIQLYMQKQYITHTSFAPYYGIHKGELEDLERVTERVTYLGPLSHIFCFNYVCTYV